MSAPTPTGPTPEGRGLQLPALLARAYVRFLAQTNDGPGHNQDQDQGQNGAAGTR